MIKDYFEDIVPPDSTRSPKAAKPMRRATLADDEETTSIPIHAKESLDSAPSPSRSIRNISVTSRSRSRDVGMSDAEFEDAVRESRKGSRWVLWGGAAVAILAVGALLILAMRPTRVELMPRTETLSFDKTAIQAEPIASASIGTLAYEVTELEFEDSEVVPSTGVVYGEDKATGNITVYNNYQTAPLKLIKNTRFESASGRVFRTPAEVIVPGKQGSTPGSVQITIVADKPGDEYNVAAGKFTLPGLKSTADMYKNVYAESADSFSGGFVGDKPGVAAGALEAAISGVRARLDAKAREAVAQLSVDVIAFSELTQITYQNLPNTTEAGDAVRIHQKALIRVPTFKPDVFISAVGRTVLGDESASGVRFVPGDGFGAEASGPPVALGKDAVSFQLHGAAQLLWIIPSEDIQKALAGKGRAEFEGLIEGFSAVKEARAFIQPFWRNVFPSEPADIKISVQDPSAAQ